MSEADEKNALLIDLSKIESVALRRLIEEVQNNGAGTRTLYDRTYHRHNR